LYLFGFYINIIFFFLLVLFCSFLYLFIYGYSFIYFLFSAYYISKELLCYVQRAEE